jgi:EAL domain-containing protein (putative c-di-GMP-specific phosphodiesterase class I)
LREKEVSTTSILLEITEGMLLDDDRQVINSLFELRSAGIQFCLDDFGTGHSSIAYLKKLDISYIKIDQSFVRDLANNVYDQKIVEGILLFAKKLGVQSVAEGIENKAQFEYLRKFECEFCQGFYFARPMLPEELIDLLEGR